MVRRGNYSFIREICIEDLDYKADYFDPAVRLTLLHSVAKYRTSKWDEEETVQVQWLVSTCMNLLITNNFGSNPLRTCKNCNE